MAISNQNEFNNEYPKEVKVIKMEDEEFAEQQLIIENYPELEELYLNDNENIEKIVLRNLKKLEKCKIWKCGVKELIIENCPQIKKLDVHNNSLTSLEFIKDLNNLENLELDGNTELTKILESTPYKGNWKTYQKVIQGSNEDNRKLLEKNLVLEEENKSLNIKYTELKRFLKEKIFVSLSHDAKQELVRELNRDILRKGSISTPGRTKELMITAEEIVKSVKEVKKELKDEIIELKEELKKLQANDPQYKKLKEDVEQKKKELEKLKSTIIKDNSLEEDDLEDIIEAQIDFLKTGDSKRLDRTKKRLTKIISNQEITSLCQLQESIIKLEIELGETEKSQINQIINNYNITGNAIINSTLGDNANLSSNTIHQQAIEQKPKSKLLPFISKNKS